MVCIQGILGKKELIKDLDFAEFDEIMKSTCAGFCLPVRASCRCYAVGHAEVEHEPS